jgi:hypothetical protein
MNFEFKFERSGSVWRAFIVNSPPRASTAPHILTDRGRPYVCWRPEPTSKEDATRIAKMWADAVAKWIDTGVSF